MLARQIPINRQRLLIYSRCGNSPRVRRVGKQIHSEKKIKKFKN